LVAKSPEPSPEPFLFVRAAFSLQRQIAERDPGRQLLTTLVAVWSLAVVIAGVITISLTASLLWGTL
jgi:hypothetical protein